MPKITNNAALIAFFDSHGDVVKDNRSRTSKYAVYKSKSRNTNFYIGKAGAVRVGNTVAASVPLNEKYRKAMIARGARIINGEPLDHHEGAAL